MNQNNNKNQSRRLPHRRLGTIYERLEQDEKNE
jgi:hypothetical protein